VSTLTNEDEIDLQKAAFRWMISIASPMNLSLLRKLRRRFMRNHPLAVILLAICPLLIAQQPQPAPETPPASTQPAAAAPPPPHTLLDGTPIKLRLSQTISSADTKVGQEVPFEVVEDISVDQVVVLPKGSNAIATVTETEHKKSMGRAGKLDIAISYARLKDQEKVALRATKETKGGGHVGAMTGAIVATSIIFFPAAPLFLFIHGKDITIPQGTEITAFVEGDMHLNMGNFGDVPSATAPAPAAAATVQAVQASLEINSTPPGADVEIDGAFVGNTPSTVSVAAGSHQVAVKKKGFTDWTKTLNVTGGTVHLNAELEPGTAPTPAPAPPQNPAPTATSAPAPN
jgi:hypothetical protein